MFCGLGIGWSEDEYQASNTPFKKRGKRANEFIQVLKKIWTDDVIEFKGEFYNIPSSKIGSNVSKSVSIVGCSRIYFILPLLLF